MGRTVAPLVLTAGQRDLLEAVARSGSGDERVVQRARALLAAADGQSTRHIAARVGVSRPTVLAWRAEFVERGLHRFGAVAPGRGRRPSIPPATIDRIVELTLHHQPPGATGWSCRSMARLVGVSPATVQRVWAARGLRPASTATPPSAPIRRDTVVDVVGLHLDPPDRAVVWAMDGASQQRLLGRVRPGQPPAAGRTGARRRPPARVVTALAALRVLAGRVASGRPDRHPAGGGPDRHLAGGRPDQKLLWFLRRVDTAMPHDLHLHVVVGHGGSYTRPELTAWLATHPRFHLHVTPASSAWLTQVQQWCHGLTGSAARTVALPSADRLVAAVEQHLRMPHGGAGLFTWAATAGQVRAGARPPGATAAERADRLGA